MSVQTTQPATPPRRHSSEKVSKHIEHAPVSGWRRMLADWRTVAGATAVCHLIGVATSLLLRMLLDPAQMGVWQTLKLLLNYGNYANLGISKGAAREFNIALGKNAAAQDDKLIDGKPYGIIAEAKHGLNLAFTVNTLTSMAYAAVLIVAGALVGIFGTGQWSSSWSIGLIAVGLLAVLTRYFAFHVTILRCTQAFRTTSRLSVIEGILTLSVCPLATWLWGLVGLYFGTLVVLLGSLAFVLRRRAMNLVWAWDTAKIKRLIAIGGPILLAGAVSSLFRSLDKLMILGYLNEREYQLGCYSVALLVTIQLYGLAEMMSIVMGPRLGEKFGHCGDRSVVARMAARATELQAALIALPASLSVVAAVPILAWLLPKYQQGLAPLVWLIPGALALSVALPAGQYLVAVNRQRRLLLVVSISTAIAALGNHMALTSGYGLSGVAGATAFAYTFYFILLTAVSIWPELATTERFRYLAMLFITIVPAMTVAIWLEHVWPGYPSGWATVMMKTTVVLFVWTITAGIAWRAGGWHRV